MDDVFCINNVFFVIFIMFFIVIIVVNVGELCVFKFCEFLFLKMYFVF